MYAIHSTDNASASDTLPVAVVSAVQMDSMRLNRIVNSDVIQCASGYYRVASGRYLGACVPCECNGHLGSCDADTVAVIIANTKHTVIIVSFVREGFCRCASAVLAKNVTATENNDLILERSRHPISGDCDLCLNNTDGRHCDTALSGIMGCYWRESCTDQTGVHFEKGSSLELPLPARVKRAAA
uniref:Laminin EGF-like domain-containing protein n=1 Tax=Parascaris univalens TaxID=6257 RepID=A0A915CIR6_PARUN